MCINGILFVLISLKQSGRFLGSYTELQCNFDVYSRDHNWTNPQTVTVRRLDGAKRGREKEVLPDQRVDTTDPAEFSMPAGLSGLSCGSKGLLRPVPSPPPLWYQEPLRHTQMRRTCWGAWQFWCTVHVPLHQMHKNQKAWFETVLNKDSGQLWLLNKRGCALSSEQ